MKIVKKAAAIVLSMSLILSLGACAKTAGSSGKSDSNSSKVNATIRFGRVNTGVGPIDAGYLDGAYKAAGITLQKQSFSAGTDEVAALVGGSLDVCLGSYEHVLRQVSNGLDIRCIALVSNSQGYKLVVKKDASYKQIKDLKGKVLGVSSAGSLSDSTLRRLLTDAKMDPQKDVQIINAGTGSTVMAAMKSGQVAAAMVNDPTCSQMVASGDYRVLVDPNFETAGLVLMCSEKWAKQNSTALKTFLHVTKDEAAKIKARCAAVDH